MKANIQNLAIGFGMVCSVCAAIWTYYNHNQTQAKIDLDAIFSINEKIELVKFKQVEILKLKRNKSDEKKCTEEEEKMKEETKKESTHYKQAGENKTKKEETK